MGRQVDDDLDYHPYHELLILWFSQSEDIIFTGGSAEEAEDFIFAIKKRAYANGKHKDNAWIAEYASICFAKKALRWYETLDEETRNDWTLLKRAILDQYDESASPSVTVPSSVPSATGYLPLTATPALYLELTSWPTYSRALLETVPAAAPSLRTGRIRVDSDIEGLKGYISAKFVEINWCCICAGQSDAAIFDYDLASRKITFRVHSHELIWLGKGYL
ncbi:hypothetical protein FRB90_011209 [Tulasnella sp. 427]|nr:hypothetical protein FRB90_011209 [Tulasnella sp. 427]